MGKIKVWISFSPWIFSYIDFFINLQMTTEWEFVFHNTTIIIFCLVYFLNIPHSTQNAPFFLLNTQYQFLQNPHFGNISSYRSGSDNFEKIISTFLFRWFYHCHRRRKYKRHSFVYRFQALNPNSIEYLRFINCYGKANKKRISWQSETWFDIDCSLEI